jgi:hypothetical protein
MPEPIFLLVLMVVTGLGVWMFLGQINSGRLGLPRLRLGLPKLPGKRRKKPRRERPPHVEQALDDPAFEDYDAGRFAPEHSPFAGPLSTAAYVQPPQVYLPPPIDDEEEGEDEYGLPANQVDFFAENAVDYRVTEHDPGPLRQVSLAPSPGLDPDLPPLVPDQPIQAEDTPVSVETATDQASPVFEVAAAEPDPNDLMSFFEKATSTSQMPETLRETLETVSAAELLAEALELRSLMQGRKDVA